MAQARADLVWRVRANLPSTEDQRTGRRALPAINMRGDVLVAQALPEATEVTRLRRTFQAIEATASVPGVSLPTTLAGLSLYNNESDDGYHYVVESIFAICTTTAAAASSMGLCHLISNGRQALPAATAITIRGTCGQVYNGKAILAAGLTVVDDGWEPYGTSVICPVSQLGAVVEAPVDGLYVVPPGHIYSVFVLTNSGALMRTKAGIRWTEQTVVKAA